MVEQGAQAGAQQPVAVLQGRLGGGGGVRGVGGEVSDRAAGFPWADPVGGQQDQPGDAGGGGQGGAQGDPAAQRKPGQDGGLDAGGGQERQQPRPVALQGGRGVAQRAAAVAGQVRREEPGVAGQRRPERRPGELGVVQPAAVQQDQGRPGAGPVGADRGAGRRDHRFVVPHGAGGGGGHARLR